MYLYAITVFEINRKHLYFRLCLKLSISGLPTCGFYLRHDLEDCAEFCNRNRFGYKHYVTHVIHGRVAKYCTAIKRHWCYFSLLSSPNLFCCRRPLLPENLHHQVSTFIFYCWLSILFYCWFSILSFLYVKC